MGTHVSDFSHRHLILENIRHVSLYLSLGFPLFYCDNIRIRTFRLLLFNLYEFWDFGINFNKRRFLLKVTNHGVVAYRENLTIRSVVKIHLRLSGSFSNPMLTVTSLCTFYVCAKQIANGVVCQICKLCPQASRSEN